ncbi:hypothetical protein QN277_010743 [Acacia crassicarpa]|uniref:Uncharacterized protein n=2 Tax=Acacia crassicarpa TaxID=499986 RepID=A0AAE1INR4_9FABA|nr:hypothetical protein QN277_010743 [Acacia crassicarpa]
MCCLISRAIEIEVMAHSLTMAAGAAASAATAISKRGRSVRGDCKCNSRSCIRFSSFLITPSAGHHYHQASASNEASPQYHCISLPRRALIISGTMLLVLSLSEHSQNARAAARKPPPSPSEEKRDPNVSGVQAKVLASKKRKDAMKQAVSKLREKGDLIKQPPQ